MNFPLQGMKIAFTLFSLLVFCVAIALAGLVGCTALNSQQCSFVNKKCPARATYY